MSNTDRSGTLKMIELQRPVSARRAVFGVCLLLLVAAPAWAQVSYSRTEVIAYQDNPSKWVMGQTASLTCAASVPASTVCDGNDVVSSVTFDPTWSLPLTYSSFGKLVQTLTYHADGTVATVKDGNNNVTTLTDWYRGIPRNIQYADGAVETAGANPQGWITSVTNAVGSKTCYGYDAMGRVNLVTQSSETTAGVCDTSAWNATVLSFVKVGVAEYGIPAGHWRQTVTTGNAQKISYFDAQWRPLVTKELDATDATSETLTKRFQRFTYDHDGRVTFASYPGTTDALTTGTWTTYDALGRVTASSQDSELSPTFLTTTTEYLAGFKTRVTNPRGHQSLTIYQVFDEPSFDAPAGIDHPEGASTEIYRDVFGKVTALRRRNADASLQVWRYYGYNDYQELCRSEEPETGTTLMGYDTAGNLKWSSSGLPAGQACEPNGTTPAVAARRSDRVYNNRNRLQTLSFPDGKGSQTWAYHTDGLPQSITTNNVSGGDQVINRYYYNQRRLLTTEHSEQPGWYTWPIVYTYDRNASLATQTYPTNLAISYAPNALGQATEARDQSGYAYASAATYYPNGALKQFTYGNGIVHSMSQNARQLPQRVLSPGVADLRYDYDQNGNVTVIGDETPGRNTGVYSRWLHYDGLDRLTDAGSCMFGGDCWHRFTYDALDNLKSWKLAGVKDYAEYVYSAQNRLSNIKNGSGASIVGLDYDAQGNLANKNNLTHLFDYGNRLRSVSSGVTTKEGYRYDGQGRRVLAWSPTLGGILSQYSLAGQILYEQDDRKAIASENIYFAGSVIALRERAYSGSTYDLKFQHTDALGSPVAVTNLAGAVTERHDYEPYGTMIGKPTYQGIGYTGHVQDGVTGLTYMQQRYYDPGIGTFLSVDPVTALGAPIGQFHRYRYANGNPYKFTDPDGRQVYSMTPPKLEREGGILLLETTADLTPVVSDIKAIGEAVRDPTVPNIASAGVGLVPVVGDVVAKGIKTGDKLLDAGRAVDGTRGTIFVDSKGNAIVTPPGGKIEGSPDGRFIQARDANGQPTGVRIDGGHRPSTHPDPRAQQPHGHVPGVKNEDGTPWLPLK
ncbi:RHS repeat-associated core domain-containing protein [Pseudoxanthomonas sp. YR558]|nr:RHS repeat-associated core domain-containing protein [Pseudoxanthomonas sp. YR558]